MIMNITACTDLVVSRMEMSSHVTAERRQPASPLPTLGNTVSMQQQNFVKDLEQILIHFVPTMVLVLVKLAKVKSKLFRKKSSLRHNVDCSV